MELSFNILAILVSSVAAFAVGFVWYSPFVFGKIWLEEMKITPGQCSKNVALPFVGTFIATLVTAFVLSAFIDLAGVTGETDGAVIGILAAIGFVATSMASNYLFEGKSLKAFFISAGHHIVAMGVMGMILAVMA